MNTFLVELMRPIRAGLHFLVRFNLSVALIGVACALAWNPAASPDDLLIVVTLPVILMFVMVRIFSAVYQPGSAPMGTDAIALAAPGENPTGIRRIMFYVMAYAVTLVALSFGAILATPLYSLLEVAWAGAFGLFMAGLLFFVGVSAFVISSCYIFPPLGTALATIVKAVGGRLLPTRVEPKDHVTTA